MTTYRLMPIIQIKQGGSLILGALTQRRIGTDYWNWHKQNWCPLNTDKFNSIFTIERILRHIGSVN